MTQQLLTRYPLSSQSLWLHLDTRLGLLLGDFIGWLLSFFLIDHIERNSALLGASLVPLLSVLFLGALSILYLLDTYQLKSQLLGCSLAWRALLASCIHLGLSVLVLSLWLPQVQFLNLSALLRSHEIASFWLGLGCFSVWCVSIRLLAVAWDKNCDRNSSWLMLTDSKTVQQLQKAFVGWTPQSRVSCLVDVVPDISTQNAASARPATHINSFHHLKSWLCRPWTAVLVSPTADLSFEQRQDLMQLRLQGGSVYNLVDFCERYWRKLPPNLLQTDWFTFQAGFSLNHSRNAANIKRLCDVFLISLLLILTLPIMALAAIAIKLSSPGPILYSQLRSGLNGEPFRVYKFRSMYQDAEKRGAQWASERDPRITPVGHWLRILRIDELPQVWNVLKGDMSLIGPRPERPEFDQELAKAIPYYQVRYSVKPGITGWAQVMYPYGASVEDAYEKVSYDFYYIKNYSLWLDLVIVLKTVRVVLFGKGR